LKSYISRVDPIRQRIADGCNLKYEISVMFLERGENKGRNSQIEKSVPLRENYALRSALQGHRGKIEMRRWMRFL
jgi:hypothetical protein